MSALLAIGLASVLCPKSPMNDVVPACAEWGYFVSAGSAWSRDSSSASFALGTEVTMGSLRYHGFPSGSYGGHRGDAEVRFGGWMLLATRGAGGLVEGGLKVHDGALYHASWGTFDVRAGLGFGAFAERRAAHGVITLGYGVRSVLTRFRSHGYGPRGAEPAIFAESSVARLVLTFRRTLEAVDGAAATETFFGFELSPTFFLPPVTWWRLAGGPPS